MSGWTPDDIPWHEFDPSRVDPQVVKITKAASLVEFNSGDYATYLCNVFHDDPRFQKAVRNWEGEERQHGVVLARWAKLADPEFDFDACFQRFLAGFRLPVDTSESVRGTRTGELISRCLVETGTHTYYSALADATDEPVLKAICRRIADDEAAHYALFHRNLARYQERERLWLWRRIRVAILRVCETQDDELPYAYYAANVFDRPYDRRENARAYSQTALGFYRPDHHARIAEMFFNAVGLSVWQGISRAVGAVTGRAICFYVRHGGRMTVA
jgi:hypothetical protein